MAFVVRGKLLGTCVRICWQLDPSCRIEEDQGQANDTKSLNYKPKGISMIIMKSKQISSFLWNPASPLRVLLPLDFYASLATSLILSASLRACGRTA